MLIWKGVGVASPLTAVGGQTELMPVAPRIQEVPGDRGLLSFFRRAGPRPARLVLSTQVRHRVSK